MKVMNLYFDYSVSQQGDRGCVPFDQSKSGFCNPKFVLRTKPILDCSGSFRLVPQWFQIFVPFFKTSFRLPECAQSSISMAGQGQFRQKLFILLRFF